MPLRRKNTNRISCRDGSYPCGAPLPCGLKTRRPLSVQANSTCDTFTGSPKNIRANFVKASGLSVVR